MEGKLIKTENGYGLKDCELIAFVSSRRPEHKHHKLSLKNCQAIENGYDLVDIKKKLFNGFDGCPDSFTLAAVERTIEVMMELMGDKKFTEEDMIMFSQYVWRENTNRRFESVQNHLDNWKKPKQEWDVTFDPDEKDVEGRLILKRKP